MIGRHPYLVGPSVLLCNSTGRGLGDCWPHYDEYEQDTTGKWKPKIDPAKIGAIKLVAGRWAGDRIVVQGDHAKPGDPGYMPKEELKDYTYIGDLVVKAVEAGDGLDP